jgi:erythromycin esterase
MTDKLKHRIFEFLVEKMGFSIFSIEASTPEAFDVNEYVLTGKGDPEKAIGGLYFWTWDTEEVLDLVLWMRQYNLNSAHRRKVKFYGFDMQFSPRAALMTLEYLRRVDPQTAPNSVLSIAIGPHQGTKSRMSSGGNAA